MEALSGKRFSTDPAKAIATSSPPIRRHHAATLKVPFLAICADEWQPTCSPQRRSTTERAADATKRAAAGPSAYEQMPQLRGGADNTATRAPRLLIRRSAEVKPINGIRRRRNIGALGTSQCAALARRQRLVLCMRPTRSGRDRFLVTVIAVANGRGVSTRPGRSQHGPATRHLPAMPARDRHRVGVPRTSEGTSPLQRR